MEAFNNTESLVSHPVSHLKKLNQNEAKVTHFFTENDAVNRRALNKFLLNQRLKNIPILHDLNTTKKLNTFKSNNNNNNNKQSIYLGNSNNLISMTAMKFRYLKYLYLYLKFSFKHF